MYPDICIHSLRMKVDPNDTSYMPSLVKVSGGNSFLSMTELTAVSIHPRDTLVTLLSDVHEVTVVNSHWIPIFSPQGLIQSI